MPKPRRLPTFAAAILVATLAPAAHAQQVADPNFDTTVSRPAFTSRHPRVAIDEAHFNFHTMSGRYEPFARLLSADGCVVSAGKSKFSAASLARVDILVISNALGHESMADSAAAHPAFTPEECEAVHAWVENGGSLLLIADHAPMGAAARDLGRAFGVDMRSGYTVDTLRAAMGPSVIGFVPGKGLDPDHPIVRGRDSSETLHRVVTFTGQSLTGPPGSVALLRLSDKAQDQMVGLGEAGPDVPDAKRLSAAGRAQGLAFGVGKGRVVVMAEAAMMSAQLAGPNQYPIGMNAPGTDDRQFALNVVRWLGRVL